MQNRVLVRQPVALPSLDSLGADLTLAMARVSAGLDGMAPVDPLLVERAPDDLLAPLRHPLSGHFVALNERSESAVRSEREREALNWLESRPSPFGSADRSSFPRILEGLNRRVIDAGGGWRTGEIGTARDLRGNTIRYPPLSCVQPQLEQLRRLLKGGARERPALFTATMALVLLTNCHPFRDGNGRVGRVLFNHVLRKGGMARDVYVPVHELAARSEGGYLIALRQGELRGQWEPFLEFVMKMLAVHQSLAKWERTASHVS